MKTWLLLLATGISALLLGCAGQPEAVEIEVTRVVPTETLSDQGVMEPTIALAATAPLAEDETTVLAQATPIAANFAGPRTQVEQPRAHLIIKDGHIHIVSPDTAAAINAIADLTVATGGYIIEQRVWEQDGYRYATMKFGVPVAEFERALKNIRTLGEVTQDIATGVDVSEEFVDLDARLGNLEITQERLRAFLSEAKKMDDIVRLNNELTRVEEEISLIKGRMNYLSERAAFSTINVQIDPIVPTPTVTPTPTATPIPTVAAWAPAETVQRAGVQLQGQMQSTADFLLYNGIVCGPWLLLLAAVAYFGLRVFLRFNPTSPLPQTGRRSLTPTSPAQEREDEAS